MTKLTLAYPDAVQIGPSSIAGSSYTSTYGLQFTVISAVKLVSAKVKGTAGSKTASIYKISGSTWTKQTDFTFTLAETDVEQTISINVSLFNAGTYWIGFPNGAPNVWRDNISTFNFPYIYENVISIDIGRAYNSTTTFAAWYFFFNLKVQSISQYKTNVGHAVFGPFSLDGIDDYSESIVTFELDLPNATQMTLYKKITLTDTEPDSWDMIGALQSSSVVSGGIASADSVYQTDYADKAFDNNDTTFWRSTTATEYHWLKYDFGANNQKVIKRIRSLSSAGITMGIYDSWTFSGSNDDSSWTILASGGVTDASTNALDCSFNNTQAYRYYRFYVTGTQAADNRIVINEFNMFDEPLINFMSIMDIEEGEDLSEKYFWIKVKMETSVLNRSPVLFSLEYNFYNADFTDKIQVNLTYDGRMRYPQGEITVDFSGSLKGPGGVYVSPFSRLFIPEIDPIWFNPHDPEYIKFSANFIRVEANDVRRSNFQSSDEAIKAMAHFISVTVTKVGGLPL